MRSFNASSVPAGVGSLLVLAAAAAMPVGRGASAADAPSIGLELNKLETQPKGCRAYSLVTNADATLLQALKLDVAILRKDGTIDRRLAFDLAPIRPNKRSIKLFALDSLLCDEISDVLFNDVMDCRNTDAALTDCLDRLKLSSRVNGVDLGR